MADDRHKDIAREALGRLAERSFRNKLTAIAPDLSRPVIPALRDDPFYRVVEQVNRSGGAGNVVVPFASGLVILALHVTHVSRDEANDHPLLSADVTVGLVLTRFLQDVDEGASMVYAMPYACSHGGDDDAELASAELSGIAE